MKHMEKREKEGGKEPLCAVLFMWHFRAGAKLLFIDIIISGRPEGNFHHTLS